MTVSRLFIMIAAQQHITANVVKQVYTMFRYSEGDDNDEHLDQWLHVASACDFCLSMPQPLSLACSALFYNITPRFLGFSFQLDDDALVEDADQNGENDDEQDQNEIEEETDDPPHIVDSPLLASRRAHLKNKLHDLASHDIHGDA